MIKLGAATLAILPLTLAFSACGGDQRSDGSDDLRAIAEEAFIYAYPMMEQIKTANGMFATLGMEPNVPTMNPRPPRENIGLPIVLNNLTSMTGGIFIDVSGGPVTLQIPEVTDRYIVYQMVDEFTHNFAYLGTRANGGEGGRFVLHNASQTPDAAAGTPIEMEGDFAFIVIRIDITDDSELEEIRRIQDAIQVVDAPATNRDYPVYDEAKAFSPDFVEYLNELLTEVPPSEAALFNRFARIGIMSDVELDSEQRAEVQAGIDAGFARIQAAMADLDVGNGYIGATEIFGSRDFMEGRYLERAVGAYFGLWGNDKAEANYFMTTVEGEGEVRFGPGDFPPLTDIGFWSITVYDDKLMNTVNPYDSYVLTADRMEFEDDGSAVFRFSSSPEEGNWLYTPTEQFSIVIRAYQADPALIGDYVPPAFIPRD